MDYPASTLVAVKGKFYVSVTVPKPLEHLFKQKQIRLSTGTSDKREARKRQFKVASKIYARFDEARANAAKSQIDEVHALMHTLADCLGYEVDVSSVMNDDTRERRHLLNAIDAVSQELAFPVSPVSNNDPKYAHLSDVAMRFTSLDVQRYIDTFREPDDRRVLLVEDTPTAVPEQPTAQSVTAVLERYIDARPWQRLKSKDAARRQIEAFAKVVRNIDVQYIEKQHAYAFASALQSAGKAQKTIASYVSAVSAMLTWCEQNAIITESPFTNLKLSKYGKKKSSWLPLSNEQLHKLFAQEMPAQDRLLLSILITTGMRLDEAALLTWEQFKVIDEIRCFDLTDAILKTASSERLVALPDCLALPPRGTGRLFNYALDADGKASRRASRILGPLIRNVTDNPRIVAHSLRGTLKDLLRNANVSKEINDFITGHSGVSDVSAYRTDLGV